MLNTHSNLWIRRTWRLLWIVYEYSFQLRIPAVSIPVSRQIVECQAHCVDWIYKTDRHVMLIYICHFSFDVMQYDQQVLNTENTCFLGVQCVSIKLKFVIITSLVSLVEKSSLYLDTKKSAQASRTLFSCRNAHATISIWTFWLSIFTVPL